MGVDEIRRALRERPTGAIRLLAGFGAGGEANVENHVQNLGEVSRRLQLARDHGFAVEAISLRHQLIDFWLRLLVVNVAPQEQRQRETGRLLRQCFETAGLEKDLYDRLLVFNDERVRAVHGFVVGAATYEELTRLVTSSTGLAADLIGFVTMHAGKVLTPEGFETEHREGDLILDVEEYVRFARSAGW